MRSAIKHQLLTRLISARHPEAKQAAEGSAATEAAAKAAVSAAQPVGAAALSGPVYVLAKPVQ